MFNKEYPTPAELARFQAEYHLTRKLESPNVISALGFEEQQTLRFIVLEDFGGRSLDDHLETIRRMPLAEVLERGRVDHVEVVVVAGLAQRNRGGDPDADVFLLVRLRPEDVALELRADVHAHTHFHAAGHRGNDRCKRDPEDDDMLPSQR